MQCRRFIGETLRPGKQNLGIDTGAVYQRAYEAIREDSLALMLSHGQRPRVQPGHHIAIIEFAQKHLDPELAPPFALFDHMRRKRIDAFYDIALLSDSEAAEAVATAEEFLRQIGNAIEARLS